MLNKTSAPHPEEVITTRMPLNLNNRRTETRRTGKNKAMPKVVRMVLLNLGME